MVWLRTPRLSSKSALLNKHRTTHSSPSLFRFSEKDTAIDYFGEQLLAAGYNYYGNEPMYSGITGQEFAADIYIGVVYYQRLRHMVLDKFQVRTTGPVDPITRQPVKVRKKGLAFSTSPSLNFISPGS
jgi:DNA-directed RNA polymerase beta subunit